MPHDRLDRVLDAHVAELDESQTAKGEELIVTALRPPTAERGARVLLEGYGDREFLRLNSNSYLGLSFHAEIVRAEEEGSRDFGAGPGAVRFISGAYGPPRRGGARMTREPWPG
jgi:glycine C-acetyltransferase